MSKIIRSTFCLIILVITIPSVLSQTNRKTIFRCAYADGNIGVDKCLEVRESLTVASLLASSSYYSFSEPSKVLKEIVDQYGLSTNFVLIPCNEIKNAIAVNDNKGYRVILYDETFLKSLNEQARSNWAAMGTFAHEVGHHLNHHLLRDDSYAKRREDELEADYFSGFTLFKLGASLSQAQSYIKSTSDVGDEETSSHPKNWRRLDAIKKGYESAESKQAPQTNVQKAIGSVGLFTLTDSLDLNQGHLWENVVIDFWSSTGVARQFLSVNNRFSNQSRSWNVINSGIHCYRVWTYTMHVSGFPILGYGEGCVSLEKGSNYSFNIIGGLNPQGYVTVKIQNASNPNQIY